MSGRRLNVVVFHNWANIGSAWCCAEGLVAVLRRMGHRVIDAGHPSRSAVRERHLLGADVILMGAPEWFHADLMRRFGPTLVKTPARKVAWYAESFHRDDRDFSFDEIRPIADLHYFPAAQDAEEFNGRWLPFGVDEQMFRPAERPARADFAFVGSMYPKRKEYVARIPIPVERLTPYTSPLLRRSIRLGKVSTMLTAAALPFLKQSFRNLADAYGSTKIFLNLPAYSRLLVTKVTEVMACRTFLLTPRLDHPSAVRNMEPFVSGKHLVYYDPERPEDIGDIVRHYLANDAEREAIAAAGYSEVLAKHTMQLRLQTILADCGLA